MLIRPIRDDEEQLYNQLVDHPLQTWEWGEFRQKTGVEVERIGFFDQGQLKKAFQLTFHPVPHLNNFSIGYFPRGYYPDDDQLSALKQIGQRHKALFIKMEPNVAYPALQTDPAKKLAQFLVKHDCQSGRPLFTRHTFQLDLTPTEEQLFANLHSKTRYNVRLAKKKGVQIVQDNSENGLNTYLEILKETTDRQGFYAHTPDYFVKMWQTLKNTDMMNIFHAVYQETTLASWIIFKFKNKIYYPYGASRDVHRDVMASNLLMWQIISWGKQQGCQILDMWGALGPEPDKKHPWYGFHRFKKGYGGELMRFVGTYDLVINPPLYQIFQLADKLRWAWLRFKTKF